MPDKKDRAQRGEGGMSGQLGTSRNYIPQGSATPGFGVT
jgi:hypothetical protein